MIIFNLINYIFNYIKSIIQTIKFTYKKVDNYKYEQVNICHNKDKNKNSSVLWFVKK